jgi:hypothetical protein
MPPTELSRKPLACENMRASTEPVEGRVLGQSWRDLFNSYLGYTAESANDAL